VHPRVSVVSAVRNELFAVGKHFNTSAVTTVTTFSHVCVFDTFHYDRCQHRVIVSRDAVWFSKTGVSIALLSVGMQSGSVRLVSASCYCQ
jgi:hypothetical protein